MKRTFVPVLAAIFSAFFACAALAKTIVIYHTSDVHGAYAARPAVWDKQNSTRTIGGFAALAAQVKKESSPVILLDSGDWYQGTPEGITTKGMASVIMMNKLGYAASAIGNHEYDFGEENLGVLASSAAFAVLGANIIDTRTNSAPSYAKPYEIVSIGGVKIGIIGLSTPATTTSTLPENVKSLKFEDMAKTVSKLAPELKAKGVNAIVVIVHDGICRKCSGQKIDGAAWQPSEKDLEDGNIAIARAAKGRIAMIFGGHIHTGIKGGYYDKESGTVIAESFHSLSCASRAELEFDDKTGKYLGAKDDLVDLWTDKTGQDPQVSAALAPITDQVKGDMDKILGETAEALVRRSDGTGVDSVIGDWFSDLTRKAAGTQIAFQNTHGIRADIAKGKITKRAVYEAMPFDNTLVIMELTGGQIEGIMRENLHGQSSGMQVSGMNVVYSAGSDGATQDILITIDGKPLEPDAYYTAATNNYLATGGGDGGKIFAAGKNINDTKRLLRDLMAAEIVSSSPIKPPACGRITKR